MDQETEDRPWTVVGNQKSLSQSDSNPKPPSTANPARIRPPILAKTPNFSVIKLFSLRTASKSTKKRAPIKPKSPPLPNLTDPPPPPSPTPPVPTPTPPNVSKTRNQHPCDATTSTQHSTSFLLVLLSWPRTMERIVSPLVGGTQSQTIPTLLAIRPIG